MNAAREVTHHLTNIDTDKGLAISIQTMPRTVILAVTACVVNHVVLFVWEMWDRAAQDASHDLFLDLLIDAISWAPALIELGLLWMIVRRANWARRVFAWWVFVWTALLFVAIFVVVIADRASLRVIFEDGFSVFVVVVSSAISLATVALLFHEKSSRWFMRPARQEPSC